MLDFHIKDSPEAKNCVIWMHGLGSNAEDMAGLASQLSFPQLIATRHIFLNAPIRAVTLNNGMPMRAWYDVFALQPGSREDENGILASEADIWRVITMELDKGISLDRIWLAGFSQGGAMALHTGLKIKGALGGVIALSAYLPLAESCSPTLANNTPIFIAYGAYDALVLPQWTQFIVNWLIKKEYSAVTSVSYPMEHAVCLQEITDLSTWFMSSMKGDGK